MYKKQSFRVPGFQFAGICAGIKNKLSKDLALIYSEHEATVVGTLTPHPSAAAPVLLCKKRLKSGKGRAVVINSGNANACTGKQGERDAAQMAQSTAQTLNLKEKDVFVCSTGIIGHWLPMDRVVRGITRAGQELSLDGAQNAAEAILTTDNGIKLQSKQGRIEKAPYHVGAFAKGAGMIEPKMKVPHATMLSFIMTDLALDLRWARRVLQECVDDSFNKISVDGDMSTNDTCLLLANGSSGIAPLKTGKRGAKTFQNDLHAMLQALAYEMVADGEGATKVVQIMVKGVRSKLMGQKIAYAVANSQLVRTSFFGGDPNWGRVLAAVGNSGTTCSPQRVDILYGDTIVCRRGASVGAAAERRAKQVMRAKDFTLTIHCHAGSASWQILSSDLGLNYVTLNSNYRT